MREFYEGIVEIQECGRRAANHYLANGYLLLDIQTKTQSRKHNWAESGANAQQYYVRRDPVYVLGRPVSAEAPPFEEKLQSNG